MKQEGGFFVDIRDFLFPKRCVNCAKIGLYICLPCRKKMALVATNECVCPVCRRPSQGGVTHSKCHSRYELDGLTSFFYYNSVVREVIKAIKYRFVSDMTSEFVSLIPRTLFGLLPMSPDEQSMLVPMPLHPARERYRGFNQAERIGSHIAGALRIPMRTDILVRIKNTDPQAEMKTHKERLDNMHMVFTMKPSAQRVISKHGVFLFDDVFTTGATMRAAAKTLKRGGAPFVWAVTMAR